MLGLKDDEQSRLAFASESHACYRTGKAKSIPVAYQREYCLEKAHITCPIFLNAGQKQPRTISAILPGQQAVKAAPPSPNLSTLEKSPTPELVDTSFSVAAPKKAPRFAHIWEFVGVLIFGLIILAGWWLFNNRDLFFPNYTPVQASIATTVVPSPTMKPTEIFIPDSAHVLALTTTPLTTLVSDTPETPGVTISPSATDTSTSTSTLTPTPSKTPSRTMVPSATTCSIPNNWVVYTVVPGDTIFYFSVLFNTTVNTILTANCTTSTMLIPGQQLYLPGVPIPPTRSPTPTGTSTSVPNTRTPTATFTSSPSFTNTPVPPTSTPTFTNIPPTETPTSPPTSTPTIAPTNTPIFQEPTLDG